MNTYPRSIGIREMLERYLAAWLKFWRPVFLNRGRYPGFKFPRVLFLNRCSAKQFFGQVISWHDQVYQDISRRITIFTIYLHEVYQDISIHLHDILIFTIFTKRSERVQKRSKLVQGKTPAWHLHNIACMAYAPASSVRLKARIS